MGWDGMGWTGVAVLDGGCGYGLEIGLIAGDFVELQWPNKNKHKRGRRGKKSRIEG
jgi:hypothetical protein